MSYSITIPVGPVDGFTDRAAAAIDAYATQLAANDVKLDDIAQGQLEIAVPAAADLITKLYGDSDVDVAVYLAGHVNAANTAGTSCAITTSTVAKPTA